MCLRILKCRVGACVLEPVVSVELKETFLHLVRLGIGHETVSGSVCQALDDVGWKMLKALADVQGLSAVVLDALNTDTTNLTDTMPVLMKLEWIGEVCRDYEQRYESYKKAISELAGFYNAHGYKMMVLKGYGCSLNWPKPNQRPCGDIDTWNFGRQEDADEVLCREKGIKVDTSEHHHTVFWWKGYMVENHYDFVIEYATKSNSLLEPVFKELGMDDSRSVLVNSAKVYLPTPNLNALFLLRHSLMEFVGTGISLRLLLDWAFFWKVEYKNIDKSWLLRIVEEHGMKDFFHIINKICVEDLGFDESIFPRTKSKKEYLKDRVLNECLLPEYDKLAAHQKGMLKRVAFKCRRWKAGCWKRELCYKEGQLESFFWSVRMHLMKPRSI